MKENLHKSPLRFAAGLLFIAAFASVSVAQDLSYKETTRMKLEGLGIIGRALGRSGTEQEVFLKDQQMLVRSKDADEVVTDLSNNRLIYINNKAKEFSIVTFEEMAEQMSAMIEENTERIEEVQQESEEDGQTQEFKFDFSADATGLEEKINGYDTGQILMTLKVEFAVENEDEEGETETMRGNFYALVDSRLSDDLPEYNQLREFQKAYAEKMGEAMGAGSGADMIGALQSAMQTDERMSAAMSKVAEEMEKVEGAPIMTTIYYVLTPEGEELNVDKVLGLEEQPKKRRGLGGIARGALKNSGINLGGDDEPEGDVEISEQKTLISITTVMDEIKSGNLKQDMFGPKDNYKEVEWKGLGG